MGFGGRTVAVAILVLAMAGQLVAQSGAGGPSSRPAGYEVSVDLTLPIGSAGRKVPLLESKEYDPGFQVWLEGDDRDYCSLSVRQIFPGRYEYSFTGYLLWSANYYSHTPKGADRCTVKFTAQGELQLWILYRGRTTLSWSSKTAGKGVTRMALTDQGNLQLLTAKNEAVFQSFNTKEWLVLSGQKFWAGMLLKNPDQLWNESSDNSNLLANSGKYIMAIKGGDLQLLINGPQPQVYWSFKTEYGFKGDTSKVRYAAVATDADEGIGLFTASGSLVYRVAIEQWVRDFGRDYHFGLDTYGNLKYWLQFRGIFWWVGWEAFTNYCNLPGYCGQYGLCTSGINEFNKPLFTCACPSGFRPAGSETTAGCTRTSHVNKCNNSKYQELPGYDSHYLRYVTPTKQSVRDCKASCSTDCKCDGVFYKVKTMQCYKVPQFLTLKKSNETITDTIAFIKVK